MESVETHSFVAANMALVPKERSAVPLPTRAEAKAFRDLMNSFLAAEEGADDGLDEWGSEQSTASSKHD